MFRLALSDVAAVSATAQSEAYKKINANATAAAVIVLISTVYTCDICLVCQIAIYTHCVGASVHRYRETERERIWYGKNGQ